MPAVAALAHDSITNGTALYRHPDPNLEVGREFRSSRIRTIISIDHSFARVPTNHNISLKPMSPLFKRRSKGPVCQMCTTPSHFHFHLVLSNWQRLRYVIIIISCDVLPKPCSQVHLAFSQFETGKYIHARFSKKTNMKLWSGHCTNIQHKLSNKDRSAFLKAVKRYQPRDIPAATPSNAFVTVPSINSRKSDSEESE